ncbi:ankyrin repeat-containing domain protein [Xylaria sp. FL0064]|nr:ankyrin repeat-containing domain protein [Xylaria sp. FL0064]
MSTSRALETYLDGIEADAQNNPRYHWLYSYLQRDPLFINEWLHPVGPGRTRTIVADFFSNPATPASLLRLDNDEDIENALVTRPDSVAVRLVLVAGISGVDENIQNQQASGTRATAVPPSESQDYRAPTLTRSRTARVRGTHPIGGHVSYLPEPSALSSVAAATQLNCDILLRHLDKQEHLVYRRQVQPRKQRKRTRSPRMWFDISIGIDQENYVTAAFCTEPRPTTGMSQSQKGGYHHTIVLLANEDNCLGIDFNTYASPLDQVFQSSYSTANEIFEKILRSKDEDERAAIVEDPLCLAWDYASVVTSKFASQLELYRRKWKLLYEKHANKTSVYGRPEDREHIREEAIQLSTHIQYMQRSLNSLRKIAPKTRKKASYPTESVLEELIQDFEHMSNQLQTLRSAYDNFIEQQLGKVSLAEARESMTEARDLQRLSYLGFVFAPLSLACSFFSTDIKPLGGPAPVWQLAVTSLAVLLFSFLVLGLLVVGNRYRHKLPSIMRPFRRNLVSDAPMIKDTAKASSPPKSASNKDGIVGEPRGEEKAVPMATDSAEHTLQARHASNVASTTATQTTQVQASQGARSRIPMNDSARYRVHLEELTRTEAYQPPPRKEFADSPKMDMSRLNNSTLTQYPIQHRRPRKKPEVSITATATLNTVSESVEKPAQSAETASPSNVNANLVTCDEQVQATFTSVIQTADGSPVAENPVAHVAQSHKVADIAAAEPKVSSRDELHGHSQTLRMKSEGKEEAFDSGNNKKAEDTVNNNQSEATNTNIATEDSDPEDHDYDKNSGSDNGSQNERVGRSGYTSGSSLDASSHASSDSDDEDEPTDHDIDDHGDVDNDNDNRSSGSIISAQQEETTFWIPASVESLPAPYKKPDFSEWDCAISNADDYAMTNFGRPLGAWRPDAEEVMIAKAFRDLCRSRDFGRIKTMISEFRKHESHLNIDGLYAWGLAEAADLSVFEALPIFYNAIKHPDTRADGLDYALQKAIGDSEEKLAIMRWLGRRGVRMNIAGVDRENPLTIACEGGHEKAVRLLLDWGADPNLKLDSFVGTSESWPLRRAVEANHMGIAQLLLKNGAHGTDPQVVQAAAKSGSLDILKALVATGATVDGPDQRFINKKFTDPFCIAAEGGHLDVMKYILGLGISLEENFGDTTRGEYAFESAARAAGRESEAICLMLLDLGVKPLFSRASSDVEYSTAHIAYTFAALGGRTALLERILDAGADPNAVVITAGTINYWLRRVGNGINSADCSYGSMLAVACGADRLDAALLLIQRGADLHYGGSSITTKTTPLHIAARNDRVSAVELLLNFGANIDARAPDTGVMPIHDAAGAGSSACIDYLLRHGAMIESLDNIGQTPLIVAAREGRLEAVENLLNEGASVSARDEDGWTAAHRAAWNGHERVMKLLLERGADPEAETDSGLKVEELLNHAEEAEGIDSDYRGESGGDSS